jgi:hypothetical protein
MSEQSGRGEASKLKSHYLPVPLKGIKVFTLYSSLGLDAVRACTTSKWQVYSAKKTSGFKPSSFL